MINNTSLEGMLDKLRTGKPFGFSRWGDGEWRSVLNTGRGQNCDGHRFFPQMGVDLGEVLRRRPEYLLGMQNFSLKQFGEKIHTWLTKQKLNDLVWYDADVFHKASINGRLNDVLEAIKDRHVVMVGPDHLKRLRPDYIQYKTFIDVPPNDAYLSRDRIIRDIKSAICDHDGDQVLVALSAGMPAGLVLDELYNKIIGKGFSIVDFGSLWDPLVGVNSRTYHRNLKKK